LGALQKDLLDSMKAAKAPNPQAKPEFLEALLLAPVAANAIVSVLKLFRSDLSIAVSDNPNFAGLFADFLVVEKSCKASLTQPPQDLVRADTIAKSNQLQKERANYLQQVKQADDFLKGKEKDTSDGMVRLRASRDALKAATDLIAPGSQGSKLTDYAAALALAAFIGDKKQMTYKLDTQQAQTTKTGTFSGSQLERSASAQVFYRVLNASGDLVDAGYLAYTTPQSKVDLGKEELVSVQPSKP
jgi:hypothetical protein